MMKESRISRAVVVAAIIFALWKFRANLVELVFKMFEISIPKSPPLLFGDRRFVWSFSWFLEIMGLARDASE